MNAAKSTTKEPPILWKDARRFPRMKSIDIVCHVHLPNGQTCPGRLQDLSLVGARLAPLSLVTLADTSIELRFEPAENPSFSILARIVRVDDEGISVRFNRMSPEVTARLRHELDAHIEEQGASLVLTERGPLSLSVEMLRNETLYDVLGLPFDVSMDQLAKVATSLVASLERLRGTVLEEERPAVEDLLSALRVLTPIWSNWFVRLRYDFSHGIVQPEERRRLAEAGGGPLPHQLREVWRSAFPQKAKEADDLERKILAGEVSAASVRDALVQLDPFGVPTVSGRGPTLSAHGEPAPVFDRFRIEKRVAVGGMGEVLLALDVANENRRAVLKRLLPELATDENAVADFLQEAHVAAALEHPCIIEIYQVGRWDGTYFIAMEYLSGFDVREIQKSCAEEKCLPIPLVARIIRDTALALDYAHHALDKKTGRPLRVVHRDVSPSNVMITETGRVKLVDFGIARSQLYASHTSTGQVRGKLRYMAPEQLRGEDITGATDQFALGIVLWELLTNEALFHGSDPVVMTSLLNDPIPSCGDVRPDLPEPLVEITMRMLAREPGDRFPRLREVAERLGPLSGSEEELARLVKNLLAPSSTPAMNDEEDFVITLRDSTHEKPISSRGVVGDLEDLPFGEIIQSLEIGQRSAELELWQESKLIAVIGVQKGICVFSACGMLVGEEAFRTVLAHVKVGTFRLRYVEPRAALMHMSSAVQMLLLDALRVSDEGETTSAARIGLVDPRFAVPGMPPPSREGREAAAAQRVEEAERARASAESKQRELEETLRRRRPIVRILSVVLGVGLGLAGFVGVHGSGAEERAAREKLDVALLALRQGHGAAAEPVLLALLSERPEDVWLWRLLGSARALSGDRAGAVEAYRAYVAHADDRGDAERVQKMLQERASDVLGTPVTATSSP